jgi:RIO-like serine/threonine protein kinase
MRSLRKILKRNRELRVHRPEMLHIQGLLSEKLNQTVQLKPAQGKAGQDQIYSVRQSHRTVAVVRIQNKYRIASNKPPKWNFRTRLDLQERLNNEWQAYETLSPAGLSPKPLWRNEAALACTWVNGKQATPYFLRAGNNFWSLADTLFDSIQKMHDCDITHMDLNLGNILFHHRTNRISFVDFEFGPAGWVTEAQQRACDYLCLIDEFCRKRRGGKVMLSDPNRVVEILNQYVREEDQSARLGDILPQLARLSRQKDLCCALRSVFPNLEMR